MKFEIVAYIDANGGTHSHTYRDPSINNRSVFKKCRMLTHKLKILFK